MSANDAMDTSTQETQPETQPTQPVSGSRRTLEAIRGVLATPAGVPAFDARHPEAWKRASGMSIALIDTTHSTNQYDMRLGCFTTRNEDGGRSFSR
jgi:hypothetical protein